MIVASTHFQAVMVARALELPPPGRGDVVYAGPRDHQRLHGRRFDRVIIARPVLDEVRRNFATWMMLREVEELATQRARPGAVTWTVST